MGDIIGHREDLCLLSDSLQTGLPAAGNFIKLPSVNRDFVHVNRKRAEGGSSNCRDEDPRPRFISDSGVNPSKSSVAQGSVLNACKMIDKFPQSSYALQAEQDAARKVLDGSSSRGFPSGQSGPSDLLAQLSYSEIPTTVSVPTFAAKERKIQESFVTSKLKKQTMPMPVAGSECTEGD